MYLNVLQTWWRVYILQLYTNEVLGLILIFISIMLYMLDLFSGQNIVVWVVIVFCEGSLFLYHQEYVPNCGEGFETAFRIVKYIYKINENKSLEKN